MLTFLFLSFLFLENLTNSLLFSNIRIWGELSILLLIIIKICFAHVNFKIKWGYDTFGRIKE